MANLVTRGRGIFTEIVARNLTIREEFVSDGAIRIDTNGTNTEPALQMGETAHVGFTVHSLDYGGGYVSDLIEVAGSVNSPKIIAIDPDAGINLLNGFVVGWLPLTDFDDLTIGNYIYTTNIAGEVLAGVPALGVRFSGQIGMLRIVSSHSGASNYNSLNIEAQAADADYIIAPRNATTAQRGLQLGVSDSRLGFFGTTGIAKPTVTGAKAGNAALGSLLTALANLGLLTDGSGA